MRNCLGLATNSAFAPLVLSLLVHARGSLIARGGHGERQLRTKDRGLENNALSLVEDEASSARRRPTSAVAPTQYFGTIHVGKPPQEFRVVFDSASGDLILPSSKCGDKACEKHQRFMAENSTTALQIGWADEPTTAVKSDDERDTKSLSLLGSDVSGEYVRDRLCMGSKGQVCGTVDFVVLTEEPDTPFQQLAFDGVMGLAPTSADATEFNVLHAMLRNKTREAGMFSLYLANDDATGELLFGGYRKERLASPLVWAAVTKETPWHVQVEDITVGGKRAGLCGDSGCQAAIDTGSSLIMAPGNMLWAMVSRLGVDDECTNASASLGFIVGGQNLELDRGDYLEHAEDGCRLLMASLSDLGKGHSTLVLGYPFLRRYYTVFDFGQSKVGFARARHGSEHSGAPPAGTAAVELMGLRP